MSRLFYIILPFATSSFKVTLTLMSSKNFFTFHLYKYVTCLVHPTLLDTMLAALVSNANCEISVDS